MSIAIKKFYNIFWQNTTCQNLFLLSKEELLDTITLGGQNFSYSYSLNRVIISNANDKIDEVETIKFRNENHIITLDESIEQKVEYFKPILEDFFDKKFRKSVEKLANDIDSKGWKVLMNLIRILTNEETREKNSIKFLQEYGFIGKNLETFDEIGTSIEKYLIPKKGNELVNENTIKTFLEGIKFVKEIYVNHSYENIYNTNQVLINTLNSEDSFESRLKLFHLLYESDIIFPSPQDDSFVECSNCEPNTYKGVLQLKMNPRKLSNLKCPVCSKELTYFIPYKLDSDIYNIIKQKDGLLLNALCYKLEENEIEFEINQFFDKDIEIDCVFEVDQYTYIVETKMYKLNTSRNKIKSKIREHYGKHIEKIGRLIKLPKFNSKNIVPILLVNVNQNNLLNEIIAELKSSNNGSLMSDCRIINLSLLKFN